MLLNNVNCQYFMQLPLLKLNLVYPDSKYLVQVWCHADMRGWED